MNLSVLVLSFLLALVAAEALVNEGAVEYNGPQTPVDSGSIKLSKFERFTDDDEHIIKARQAAAPQNTTVEDNHDYYMSSYYPAGPEADALFFDLAQQSNTEVVIANISDDFRFYSIDDLPFEFQFYGHTVNQVGVSTGGFLYVGPWFHSQIHLTQFIAPLQGDFNPGINDSALIYIYQDDDRYTVQWDEVHNHDHVDAGPFTFQVSLFRNGTIHFVYKDIPLAVTDINNDDHPVFVGLADSFYFDTPIPGGFISRTIYEYHRIFLNATLDLSNSAYVITPVPNCISVNSCDDCVARSLSSEFDCAWCEQLGRCSDGIDRHRQEWFASGCFIEGTTSCEAPTTMPPPTTNSTTTVTETPPTTITTVPTTTVGIASETTTSSPPSTNTSTASSTTMASQSTSPSTTKITTTTASGSPVVDTQTGSSLGTGPTIGIVVVLIVLLVIILLVTAVGVVLWYGYKKPTSSIGLFMIEHRPKARSLNKTSKAAYNVETGKTALSDAYA